MASLSFNSLSFTLRPHESVLDCLLRHGQPIPYSCKAGMCQACLVKAVSPPPAAAQAGLKASLREQGCALACQWYPSSDVAVDAVDPKAFAVAARIRELAPLNGYVMKVLLEPLEPMALFGSRPGQYLTITNPNGVVRSYSLANDFALDHVMEFHIGGTQYGLFTRWLFDNARVGDVVHLRGPAGDCYYDPRHLSEETPLLLAGAGAGLAPLYGILRDALRRGHRGKIQLFHGGHSVARLYYVDELRELARQHPNFLYHPCVRDAEGTAHAGEFFVGGLETAVAQHLDAKAAAQTRAYVAGPPDFVQLLCKRLFLAGIKPTHIHADHFTERTVQTD